MRAFWRPTSSMLQLSKKLPAADWSRGLNLLQFTKCDVSSLAALNPALKPMAPKDFEVWNGTRKYSSDSVPGSTTLMSSSSSLSSPPPLASAPPPSPASFKKLDIGSGNENEIDMKKLGCSKEKIDIDGMLINWDKAGTGDHVVLLLPGIIGTIRHDFAPLFKKMDLSKYTLVSWDPPGYGLSRPPQRDFSGVFYRRDGHIVVKLMDKLGFDKFSILGWSNGGITGGYIAADYPSRVKHLVTWGAHAYADDRAVFFTNIMRDLDVWSKKMLEPAITLYGREYLLKMMNEWHKAVKHFRQEGLSTTFKEGLARITCPALIIHGEEDPVLGVEHAEFMRDHIANAKMWIMPNGKHNLHLRYTDDFLKVVTKFLEK